MAAKQIDSCGTCRSEVKESHQALLCNLCEMWHHIECENVNVDTYDFLVKNEEKSLHWYCIKCNAVAGKIVSSVTTITRKYKELEAKVNALEEDTEEKFSEVREELMNKPDIGDIDQALVGIETTNKTVENLQKYMNDKIDNLTLQLGNMSSLEHKVIESNKREMENCLKHLNEKSALTDQRLQNYQGAGAVSTLTHTAENNLPNLIRKELAERDDIELRKMNLIITGMREPEVTENNGDLEIMQKDEDCFKSMIHQELSINITEIKVVRLGRKTRDKPRMMKIALTNPKERKDLLTKAKMLREATNEAARNVYIRPDLTIKQRDEAKNLRSQLKELRERNPSKRYVIKFNQIKEI